MKNKENNYITLKRLIDSFSSLVISCIRILKMSKKPSKEEYLLTLKISSIGILFIGILGFLFYLIMDIAPKLV